MRVDELQQPNKDRKKPLLAIFWFLALLMVFDGAHTANTERGVFPWDFGPSSRLLVLNPGTSKESLPSSVHGLDSALKINQGRHRSLNGICNLFNGRARADCINIQWRASWCVISWKRSRSVTASLSCRDQAASQTAVNTECYRHGYSINISFVFLVFFPLSNPLNTQAVTSTMIYAL